jgi:beta-glucanase (GH16 family)
MTQRPILAVCAMVIAASCHHPTAVTINPPPPPPPPPKHWALLWSDEFDGPAGSRVDTTKWTYNIGDGCSIGICGWGNNEKEYYSDSSANVQLNGSGQLVITARVAPPGMSCYYGTCRYTSGKLDTRDKVTISPTGKVEARIKLPAGQGLWPAFWMLGTANVGWPAMGEMDIMENHGSNMTSTSSAVHGPGYSGNTPFARVFVLPDGALFSDDFHVFAVTWDATAIHYWVDGAQFYEVSRGSVLQYGNWVFDNPFFILLNLAVGGNFDHDPVSDAIFPATMVVDYVRVYTWSE